MMPKRTFTIVANELYRQRCDELDAILEQSMIEAFKGERISIERRDRILKKFSKNVMKNAK